MAQLLQILSHLFLLPHQRKEVLHHTAGGVPPLDPKGLIVNDSQCEGCKFSLSLILCVTYDLWLPPSKISRTVILRCGMSGLYAEAFAVCNNTEFSELTHIEN